MLASITPSQVTGALTIPPSKSMAHRAIICAALSQGTSVIRNIEYSKDIIATLDGMELMGAKIERRERQVRIQGVSTFHSHKQEVFCNESGSTLRFFIPIFSLCNQELTFTGAGRLLQRPQTVYQDVFHEQGLTFLQDEDGIHIHESLQPGTYSLQGNISSQFISGLLFTLPLLKGDSILRIQPPFESKSYIDLTMQMLSLFGVQVSYIDENTLQIPGGQCYQAHDYTIEGDYSQMAFFAVLAAISHDLTIMGMKHDSQQGDKAILKILTDFGVRFEELPEGYRIYKSKLRAAEIDLANCPDLGPIACVLAMYSPGNTVIRNAERLRIKESDRIAAMEEELKKIDVSIHSTKGEIFIQGKTSYQCHQTLYGHNDHRIVMALTVALLCCENSGNIEGAQAITKSYPSFFNDIQKIEGQVTCHDE